LLDIQQLHYTLVSGDFIPYSVPRGMQRVILREQDTPDRLPEALEG